MPVGCAFPEGMHKGTVHARNLLCKLDIHWGQYMVLLHIPGCFSGQMWHTSRVDSSQFFYILSRIRRDKFMYQSLAVTAISNFCPTVKMCLMSGLISSWSVNCLHSTGPGSSSALTHYGSPRDTLGPPVLIFGELVRNQGQTWGLRVTWGEGGPSRREGQWGPHSTCPLHVLSLASLLGWRGHIRGNTDSLGSERPPA